MFDHNLDDKTRKKVMQKIRNRISAQESRDRKKNQFNQLVNNNIQLIESSLNMKKRYENLQRENEMLRAKLQPQEPQDKLLRLNSLFGSISKKGSRTELKPFSLFILTMLIYSILRPEKGTFSDHIASTENVIAGSSIPLTENIVGKIESLCNEFAKKLGMDAEFLFKEKLFGKKSEFDFNSILNLGDEMNQPESNSAEAERSQIELETELRKQFYTIFQESLNSDYYQYDNDSSDHEYTKSQSSSREDGKSSMEIEMGTTENNY